MKCIIIEDEKIAAERLVKLIHEYDSSIEVIAVLQSVRKAVEWFQANEKPDLAFFDIQLADGLSFEIFEQVDVKVPIIFTTAFDEYAIKAFQLNSLDYLLKPINKSKLSLSLEKYKRFKTSTPIVQIEDLLQSMADKSTAYKRRFAINIGTKIKSIESKNISFFESVEKNTFLHTLDGHSYPVDFSLDKLESLLNPDEFFRTNRQTIVQYAALDKINILSKSRVQVLPKGSSQNILISTAKTHSFRKWLDK